MMAEGDGEVKREVVEAGAGGAGGQPTGAREPTGEEVEQQGPAAERAPRAHAPDPQAGDHPPSRWQHPAAADSLRRIHP